MTLGDYAAAVLVVVMVAAIIAITQRMPYPPPSGRISARSMRNLLQRLDAERHEHPERQS